MAITLQDIKSYWANTPALYNQIPANSVYVEVMPERLVFPYAVLRDYSSSPEYTTTADYINNVAFTVEVWTNSLPTSQTIAAAIDSQFALAKPATRTVGCWQTGYKISAEEHPQPNLYGYGVALTYLLIVQDES